MCSSLKPAELPGTSGITFPSKAVQSAVSSTRHKKTAFPTSTSTAQGFAAEVVTASPQRLAISARILEVTAVYLPKQKSLDS